MKIIRVTPKPGANLSVNDGNNIYRSPAPDKGWFEQTYPYNKVAIPEQNNSGWRWTTS